MNWYKFILTDKRYSSIDKLEFFVGHVLILLSIYFLYKAMANFEEARKFIGIFFLLLAPILVNVRKIYNKFTQPFDEYNFKNKEMTSQQKEILKVKEKLIESAEDNTKVI